MADIVLDIQGTPATPGAGKLISVNPGASGVWTHQVVIAEMSNM